MEADVVHPTTINDASWQTILVWQDQEQQWRQTLSILQPLHEPFPAGIAISGKERLSHSLKI